MCAEILKDVLKPVDQVWMTERFKIAAVARYRRLSGACDDQLPFGQHQKGDSPDAGVIPRRCMSHWPDAWQHEHAEMQIIGCQKLQGAQPDHELQEVGVACVSCVTAGKLSSAHGHGYITSTALELRASHGQRGSIMLPAAVWGV